VNQGKEPEKSPGGMRYAGLGIQLALSIIVFVFAGQWLDRHFGTNGIFTIVGAFVGFGGTMYSLVRQLSNKDDAPK
jgi:F0F1-type ATP synthase assembly protein I